MAVRYPGWLEDEGAVPSMPEGRAPEGRADVPRASTGEAARELAHPPRLPRHTPVRGPVAAALHARGGDGITCVVPAAAAALVREALEVALPGVPVTVTAGAAAGARAPAGAEVAAAWAALRRTQRRVAASDVAMGLQHALANPLTALLFEAQLLEMEALPPALAEAVGRIVTHCRRTIEVARQLDAAGAGAPTASAAPSPRHDIRNPM